AYCFALWPLVHGVELSMRDDRFRAWVDRWPTALRWSRDYVLFASILLLGDFTDTPFVYFQF
ncbi:MAG: hypothetical protein AAF211_31190, partial [Myxococcota bacterium]